ncbi:MAG: outer membrane protein assembly factor [Deltaproteobacteria bacterium]|nr:outer membrane protein assembly factor [Deltaproteobacteria bacterium]
MVVSCYHRARFFLRLLMLLGCCLLLLPPSAAHSAALNLAIKGITGDCLKNVDKALALPGVLQRDEKVNPLWRQHFISQAAEKVKRALELFGYYHAQINLELDEKVQPPLLTVKIDPGAPILVARKEIRIEGDSVVLTRRLKPFPLQHGAVFRHDLYEQGKSDLLGLAVELGYLDAAFTRHQVTVDTASNSAVIDLELDLGPRYHIGTIHFSGAPDYPDAFLKRYLNLPPGSVFSYARLGLAKQNFLDSDRFRSVTIRPRKDQAVDAELPLTIDLEPAPSRRLRAGLGYGTDTGARLNCRGQDLNLLHRGHTLAADILLAELRQEIGLSYIIPDQRNLTSMTTLRGGYRKENLDTYETRYFFTEAERVYGLAPKKTASIFLRLLAERSDLGGEQINSELVIPGVRYQRAKLDNALRPTRGFRWSLEGRCPLDLNFSGLPALQFLGDLQLIRPLPWNSLLLLRGAGGTTLQKDTFNDLPASLRFFTGGDNSVRGYSYRSLGPTDAENEVVGGRHFLAGSLELEHRLTQDWAVAGFFDIGNAFDSFSAIAARKAAGLGLRYYTPVGPARLDLARTIGDERNRFRIHIGLGVNW